MIEPLRDLVSSAGMPGWIAWLTMLASVVVSTAVLIAARARPSAGSSAMSAAAIGGVLAAWAGVVGLVRWTRAALLAEDVQSWTGQTIRLFYVHQSAVTLLPWALLLLTAWGVAAAVVPWSRVVPRSSAWLGGACLAAPALVALAEVLGWATDVREALARSAMSIETDRMTALAGAVTHAHEHWLDTHAFIAAAAVVGCVVGATLARRTTRSSWGPVLGGGILLGLGIAAFAATRGHAADAGAVIPPHPLTFGLFDPTVTPVGRRCEPVPIGPVLAVDGARTLLDGRQVGEGELASTLETRLRNRAILHPANVDEPFVLLLAAPPSTRLAALARRLEASERAGVEQLALVTHRARSVTTATRGEIDIPELCVLPIRVVAEGGIALPPTVGELAAQAEHDPGLALNLRR